MEEAHECLEYLRSVGENHRVREDLGEAHLAASCQRICRRQILLQSQSVP